ncbi:leucine-rich repeat domain-containing protein [Vibrio nigripulchritudo]|uniref:leucine-rich repeat domain-containing protein n=1 Tax=Vibrio nigripulchritudo TaxID=28173 RepID=UPI0003B208B3|nr:leucine-rich repeat domain-containing protein [Vibrio nigripulchritudo]CCN69712.1 exported hypothetical protein [Vibrio nigripulchritudo SFn118]
MIKIWLISLFVFCSPPLSAYETEERQRILSYSPEAERFVEIHKSYRGYSYVLEEGKRISYLPESESKIDNSAVVRMFKKASFNNGKYRSFYTYRTYQNHAVVNENGNIIQLVLRVIPKENINHNELMDFISSLQNLEYLSIEFNNERIRELNLTKLEELKQIRLYDLDDGIISLPVNSDLEIFRLFSRKDVKINNIKNQKNLRASDLTGALLKFYDFENLNNLEVLDLSYSRDQIHDNDVIFNVSKLSKLRVLFLPTGMNIKSTGLKNLDNLKKLGLGANNNYSDNIIPKNVEHLYGGGKINRKIPNLSRNKKLKRLMLRNTSLKDLEGLSDLTDLEEVIIDESKLESLGGLKNLPSLKTLTIHYGNLKTIGNIHSLDSLEEMELEYHQFENLDGLKNLPSLKTLKIDGGTINKLERLEGVDKLRKLVLLNQNITKVENIDHFKNLKYVSYRGNPIEELDFKNIENLAYCKVDISETKFFDSMSDVDKKKLKNLHRKGNLNGRQ